MTKGKKLRRICLFLMLISLCGLFTGCKNKDDNAVDESLTVKIGVLLDFTGDKAEESEEMYKAVQLAVDEINEAGGVLTEKLKLELVKKDDGGNYMNSVAGYYQLVDEGVCAVIGTNNSQGMEELIKASSMSNVPIITPSVSDDFVVNASNFVYQSCVSDKYMTEALAYFAQTELGKPRTAMIYSAQSEREQVLYEDFAAEILKRKIDPACVKELEAYDEDSIKAAVGAVIDAGAEAVFAATGSQELELIINEAYRQGYTGVFLGMPECADGLTVTHGYNVYVPCNMALDRESTYVTEFVDKLGKITGDGVRPAYDAVYFIRDAIEKGYLSTSASIALKLPFLAGSTMLGEYVIGAYGDVEKTVDILLVTDDKKSYAGTVFE